MANYKETLADGSAYMRCHTVTIYNSLGAQPSVHFQEETIVSVGDKTFSTMSEGVRLPVVPESEIAVVDPETNLPTGEVVTHGRLYQLLYSAYIQTALERDAGNV